MAGGPWPERSVGSLCHGTPWVSLVVVFGGKIDGHGLPGGLIIHQKYPSSPKSFKGQDTIRWRFLVYLVGVSHLPGISIFPEKRTPMPWDSSYAMGVASMALEGPKGFRGKNGSTEIGLVKGKLRRDFLVRCNKKVQGSSLTWAEGRACGQPWR